MGYPPVLVRFLLSRFGRDLGRIGYICHSFQLVQHGFQFRPVSGDHLLLLPGRLDDDRHLIAVAGDQGLAAFKLGDAADLGAGQLQDILDVLCLVRLQVQDDLCLGVVENGPSVAAIRLQQRLRHSRG